MLTCKKKIDRCRRVEARDTRVNLMRFNVLACLFY